MPKKVVHVLKASGIHGTEKHLLALLPKLAGEYRIELIVLTEPQLSLTDYFNALAARDITAHRVVIRRDLDPGCLLQLVRMLKGIRPDMVHTHLIHGDLYGTLAARCAGVPIIISTRHNDDTFRTRPVIKQLNRLLAAQADRIITISQWIARFVQKVEKVPLEKISTIYYGLDTIRPMRATADTRRELGLTPDHLAMGIIARLVTQKGHRYLIDAFAALFRENRRLRLLIVGDGPEQQALRAQVHAHGIADGVIFQAYRSDVPDVLAAIDLFVHPSLWEGFGLAILEAMAMGKPIVATTVSAVPELIEHNVSGLLVAPRDAAALADALHSLCNDQPRRSALGRQARTRWQTNFSITSMVQQTLQLYADVLDPPGKETAA